MRRTASMAAPLICLAVLLAACSSRPAPEPKVSSTAGPAVTATLDRCFIDPTLDHQAVADVTAINHSGTEHDIIVNVRFTTAEGTFNDLAVVHSVGPGQSGTGGTSNHLPNSHSPTCVITGVQAL